MTSRSDSTRARRRGWRRSLLGLLALGAVAMPGLFGGCAPSFDPPTELNGLRVLAVTADKSYAKPDEAVTFKMSYQDTPASPDDSSRAVNILWIRGCTNPPGDSYYGCYGELAKNITRLFEWLQAQDPTKPLPALPADLVGVVGFTDEFTMKPWDNLMPPTPPKTGPYYGLGYVFFMACAGTPGPVSDQGSGEAGSFPFGCFDGEGRRLGADSFVPGYTQIYAYDNREPGAEAPVWLTNENPLIQELQFDGATMEEVDLQKIPTVEPCPITEEERKVSGCSAPDPTTECQTYTIKAVVDPSNVAEADSGAEDKTLTEAVWVSYFVDQGELTGGIKLVNDATTGYIEEHEAKWIPPSEDGIVTVWAVLRDARGGSSVMKRLIRVTPKSASDASDGGGAP